MSMGRRLRCRSACAHDNACRPGTARFRCLVIAGYDWRKTRRNVCHVEQARPPAGVHRGSHHACAPADRFRNRFGVPNELPSGTGSPTSLWRGRSTMLPTSWTSAPDPVSPDCRRYGFGNVALVAACPSDAFLRRMVVSRKTGAGRPCTMTRGQLHLSFERPRRAAGARSSRCVIHTAI